MYAVYPILTVQALMGILTEQKFISDCRYTVNECSSLVSVVFSYPYISFVHLLVNGFCVVVIRFIMSIQ